MEHLAAALWIQQGQQGGLWISGASLAGWLSAAGLVIALLSFLGNYYGGRASAARAQGNFEATVSAALSSVKTDIVRIDKVNDEQWGEINELKREGKGVSDRLSKLEGSHDVYVGSHRRSHGSA